MTARSFGVLVFAMLPFVPSPSAAQDRIPERSVRRDIPMTNMIRRAHAAGTRDSTGRPTRKYWQLWTDYRITARLDTVTSIISGRETVTFRNNSDTPMTSVVLRLDQNIFRPDAGRVVEWAPQRWDEDFRSSQRPVAERDRHLSAPIPNSSPGRHPSREFSDRPRQGFRWRTGCSHSSGTLEADELRSSAASRVSGFRMGRLRLALSGAQWYRVSRLDDLREGGWDTEPYLGNAEFYNNFGRFDVSLDVPAGWVVGATGVLQNPTEVLTPTARERLSRVLTSDSVRTIVSAAERGPGRSTTAGTNGRLVWRFVADTVNDFAWATSNSTSGKRHAPAFPRKAQCRSTSSTFRQHPAVRRWAAGSRHALEYTRSSGSVRISAAHDGGWAGAGDGIPDVHHVPECRLRITKSGTSGGR